MGTLTVEDAQSMPSLTPRINEEVDVLESEQDYKTVGKPLVSNPKMSMRNVNIYYADKQAIFDVSIDISG